MPRHRWPSLQLYAFHRYTPEFLPLIHLARRFECSSRAGASGISHIRLWTDRLRALYAQYLINALHPPYYTASAV